MCVCVGGGVDRAITLSQARMRLWASGGCFRPAETMPCGIASRPPARPGPAGLGRAGPRRGVAAETAPPSRPRDSGLGPGGAVRPVARPWPRSPVSAGRSRPVLRPASRAAAAAAAAASTVPGRIVAAVRAMDPSISNGEVLSSLRILPSFSTVQIPLPHHTQTRLGARQHLRPRNSCRSPHRLSTAASQ